MPTAYKILGQSCPANTNETTLYTVPSSTQSVVSTLTITNITASAALASVYVKNNGAAISNSNTLLKNVNVDANSIATFTIGLTIDAADVISVQSSSANSLAFQLFGSEIS